MSLVSRSGDLDAAISQAAATDGLEPVLEEYVAGDPVTVGLLQLPAGVIVLPPLATRPRHAALYDARAKMDPRGEGLVAYEAAALPAGDDQLLRDLSLRIWHGTGCAGMARIDYIVGRPGRWPWRSTPCPAWRRARTSSPPLAWPGSPTRT